jgi:hypothetical protein
VSAHVASAPQGQGHRTVIAQVIADVLGLAPADVRVTSDVDTARDAWSIASGNYSSRFAPAVCSAAHTAAMKLKERLARIAAAQLNVTADQIVFAGGKIGARSNPANAVPFARLAATSHWAPGVQPSDVDQAIRETVFWTHPELTPPTENDMINSSLCHGFIFDFCGVEIDRITGQARIDKYVTMHDCGRVLHPGMVEGQINGAFGHHERVHINPFDDNAVSAVTGFDHVRMRETGPIELGPDMRIEKFLLAICFHAKSHGVDGGHDCFLSWAQSHPEVRNLVACRIVDHALDIDDHRWFIANSLGVMAAGQHTNIASLAVEFGGHRLWQRRS